MTVRWKQLDIMTSSKPSSAELVLVSGPPYVCRGSEHARQRAGAAVEALRFAPDFGRELALLEERETAAPVLVLGMGAGRCSDEHWASLGGHLYDAMKRYRLESIRLPTAEELGARSAARSLLLGALLHSYRFDYKTNVGASVFEPRHLIYAEQDSQCVREVSQCALAVNRARAWAEEPANFLTPESWASEAQAVFRELGARVHVLGPSELEKLGAGALLAVGRGSEHGPRLLAVEWRGDQKRAQWDTAFIGKGLTFDSGGLNLKPINISKMKFDMAGGAAVLGALELAIRRGARCNVVAIVPIAENSVDALAFRPGDVIRSLSGITIEVVDTDAEGRLVLADAITYAIRNYQPRHVIDLATLTGVVMNVLHEEFAALYTSSDRLGSELLAAGDATAERLWRLPLDPSQDYLVESQIADVRNLGPAGFYGRAMGSPTAGAKFIEKFAHGVEWAHIDMTGPAWSTRRTAYGAPGATGYGARLLDRWLISREVGFEKPAE